MEFPGKNTEVGYFLPPKNLPHLTQEMNLGLLHFRWFSALQANSLLTEPQGRGYLSNWAHFS